MGKPGAKQAPPGRSMQTCDGRQALPPACLPPAADHPPLTCLRQRWRPGLCHNAWPGGLRWQRLQAWGPGGGRGAGGRGHVAGVAGPGRDGATARPRRRRRCWCWGTRPPPPAPPASPPLSSERHPGKGSGSCITALCAPLSFRAAGPRTQLRPHQTSHDIEDIMDSHSIWVRCHQRQLPWSAAFSWLCCCATAHWAQDRGETRVSL